MGSEVKAALTEGGGDALLLQVVKREEEKTMVDELGEREAGKEMASRSKLIGSSTGPRPILAVR